MQYQFTVDRQHDSSVMLNENGGYQKPGVDCDQQRNLAIPIEKKDHNYCRILTRVNEYRGRQGIQVNQRFQRIEAKLNHLQEIVSDKGKTRDESACLKSVTLITLVHDLENRPFQSGQVYIPDILDSQISMVFPLLHS